MTPRLSRAILALDSVTDAQDVAERNALAEVARMFAPKRAAVTQEYQDARREVDAGR